MHLWRRDGNLFGELKLACGFMLKMDVKRYKDVSRRNKQDESCVMALFDPEEKSAHTDSQKLALPLAATLNPKLTKYREPKTHVMVCSKPSTREALAKPSPFDQQEICMGNEKSIWRHRYHLLSPKQYSKKQL